MTLKEVLDKLFPSGSRILREGNVIYGEGSAAVGPVAIIGTTDNTVIGIKEILLLSARFLAVMRENPGRPILMLVDNHGQRMALEDELLGLNQYIAHLIKTQDMARRQGHSVLALVYGNSIAGGFIACGLCAGRTYAVSDSNTSVMILPAIARITKLSEDYLQELSKTVSVFAPGVKNFYQTGGLHAVWEGDLAVCLEQALREGDDGDNRAELGKKRGGRKAAADIAQAIINC